MLAFLFPHEPLIPFGAAAIGLSAITSKDSGECGGWLSATWGFAKQITPLLLGGVLISGLLLGRPGNEGIISNAWVTNLVGGNSLWANLFASIAGAFMYFATLTEVPILQGLIGSGMGKGRSPKQTGTLTHSKNPRLPVPDCGLKVAKANG